MKGVIVQVGDPKSIVLFNNGKISAISTPPLCHVGMVVTLKTNHLLKIILISIAAVLLITLGVFIGSLFFTNKSNQPIDNRQNTEFWSRPMRGRGWCR